MWIKCSKDRTHDRYGMLHAILDRAQRVSLDSHHAHTHNTGAGTEVNDKRHVKRREIERAIKYERIGAPEMISHSDLAAPPAHVLTNLQPASWPTCRADRL